jgi:class 3 adenylate cyclase
MTKKVERKPTAIPSADVVGYYHRSLVLEAHGGADETGTLTRLKAHRVELFDPITKMNSGRIVKRTGDGALTIASVGVISLIPRPNAC